MSKCREIIMAKDPNMRGGLVIELKNCGVKDSD